MGHRSLYVIWVLTMIFLLASDFAVAYEEFDAQRADNSKLTTATKIHANLQLKVGMDGAKDESYTDPADAGHLEYHARESGFIEINARFRPEAIFDINSIPAQYRVAGQMQHRLVSSGNYTYREECHLENSKHDPYPPPGKTRLIREQQICEVSKSIDDTVSYIALSQPPGLPQNAFSQARVLDLSRNPLFLEIFPYKDGSHHFKLDVAFKVDSAQQGMDSTTSPHPAWNWSEPINNRYEKTVRFTLAGIIPRGQKSIVLMDEHMSDYFKAFETSPYNADRHIRVSGELSFTPAGTQSVKSQRIHRPFVDPACPGSYGGMQGYTITLDEGALKISVIVEMKAARPAPSKTFSTTITDNKLTVRVAGTAPPPAPLRTEAMIQLANQWSSQIDAVWNNQFQIQRADGSGQPIPVEFSARFVPSAAAHMQTDQVINVFPGDGRSDASNFYGGANGGGYGDFASHEFGHFFGLYDEYPDEKCGSRIVPSGDSLMKAVGQPPQARHLHDFVQWVERSTGARWNVITTTYQ